MKIRRKDYHGVLNDRDKIKSSYIQWWITHSNWENSRNHFNRGIPIGMHVSSTSEEGVSYDLGMHAVGTLCNVDGNRNAI
jgi:hypothetical protein